MEALVHLTTTVYVVVAIAVGLRARVTEQLALGRLTVFLLDIAAITAAAPLIQSDLAAVGIALIAVALLLYPVLLLWFGAAVARARRTLERIARWVLVVELAAGVAVLVAMDGRASLVTVFVLSAALAVVAHGVVAVTLVAQVRRQASGFLRRRAAVLAGGVMLLGAALGIGTFGQTGLASASVWALVLGTVAAVLLAAATAPPRWLQVLFVLPDHDRLAAAERDLQTGDDPAAALTGLLGTLVGLIDGVAGWYARDGQVVARVGDVGSFARPKVDDGGDAAPIGAARRMLVEQVDDGHGESVWIVRSVGTDGELGIVSGADPILFGLDVADLLPRTADRIGLALDGRQAAARRREQERAEQELAHVREIAAVKDDVLSTINHELRTPLTLVNGVMELLVHRGAAMPDEQRQQLLERAGDHAGQLTGVVDQVLALAEFRGGVTTTESRPVEVAALLDRCRTTLAARERITIESTDVTLVTDEFLLERTLTELCRNALRHTDGPVRVTVGSEAEQVELAVHDHGEGLDEDMLGPLVRGGHYLHRTTRGLGLGLTLAMETASLLGGTIAVDNTTAGARVSIVVPRVTHVAPVVLDEEVVALPR